MSYGDFTAQITQRGATAISRDRDAKLTSFIYHGKTWICVDAARAPMTAGLADGYEMEYCLAEHCQPKEAEHRNP